jgi:hypothetical protein
VGQCCSRLVALRGVAGEIRSCWRCVISIYAFLRASARGMLSPRRARAAAVVTALVIPFALFVAASFMNRASALPRRCCCGQLAVWMDAGSRVRRASPRRYRWSRYRCVSPFDAMDAMVVGGVIGVMQTQRAPGTSAR